MTESLGGLYGELKVRMYNGKYFFYNPDYGMEMYVHPEDIREVLAHPTRTKWSSNSYSNSVEPRDKEKILEYLKSKTKYKSVEDVLKSRSKYKKKYLTQFSFDELERYIKEKEKNYVKVESRSS